MMYDVVVDWKGEDQYSRDTLLNAGRVETSLRRAHERLKEIKTEPHVSVEVEYGGKSRIT